ncbi:ATP-grasp domain-containing protein [Dubosiella newyorkensis]|uniref:ATP-grasp domain-containing protein n=1 Tax=Dubosiella newyorkensis TaxID=1862672 RepID=UPI0023F0EF17|nr:ATP-grasp domain-containing protein [Dubosiella newyorkensis]
MNFIYISPQFPKTNWYFCDRLSKNGVRVLGIGDTPYDQLDPLLKNALVEYYYVPSMESYADMFRAVAYYAFKYGRIDWIESNNEYWLEQDAKLREDFNVKTGVQPSHIAYFKSKYKMKEKYREANIPSAASIRYTDLETAKKWADSIGYPLIAKPETGVGASDVFKLKNEDDLRSFDANKPQEEYVLEEFIEGDIVSYDAIVNDKGEPIFESMTYWPPSIADIVNQDLDLAYYVSPELDPELKTLGQNAIQAFHAYSRFIHLEFFKTKRKNTYYGLEVNMRPAGGYTPDMMNFAHSVDVYQIYADMVTKKQPVANQEASQSYCVYASQKDGKPYLHSHDKILERYKDKLVMCERMPEMMVRTMGNQMYTVKLDTREEKDAFIQYVLDQAE